jgi:hypothetical protein
MKTNLFEIPTTGFFSKPMIRRILSAARRLFPTTYFSPPQDGSITLVFPEPVSAPEFLNNALGLCRVHEFTYIGDPRLTHICSSCHREEEEWAELYVPSPVVLPDPELEEMESGLLPEEKVEDIYLTSADLTLGELAQLEMYAR